MSINKHKQTICDVTKIILDDGVTLLPGYIEIKDRRILSHFSMDPRNRDNNLKPGVLKNRVEFRGVKDVLPAPKAFPDGFHFLDIDLYHKFLKSFLEKLEAKAKTKKKKK